MRITTVDTEHKPRAAIYARLSVAKRREGDEEDAASESVENQIQALTALAATKGLDLVATYSDDGRSGWSGAFRPGFREMRDAMARREFDLILVRHPDRLSRNDAESSIIRTESARYGVRWMTSDGSVTDPASSGGAMSSKVFAAVSEYESAVKSERLREHYAGRAARGELLPRGGVFGYADEDRTKVVRWEADLIAAAYAAVASGGTVGGIVRQWNAAEIPQRRGGRQWTYAHLNSILKRHRNAGIVTHRGEVLEGVEGQWERIVEPETFRKVYAILSSPARRTSPGFTPRYLTSGIARCGTCGGAMRSNTAVDKRRRGADGKSLRTPILRCESAKGGVIHGCAILTDQPVMRRGAATGEIRVGLESLVRREVLRAFLVGPRSLFAEASAVPREALWGRLAEIENRRESVLRMSAGSRAAEVTARRVLLDLDEEEATVRAQIDAALAHSAAPRLQDIREGLWTGGRAPYADAAETLARLGQRFDALSPEERRALVARLLDITVKRGRGAGKYEIRHRVVTALNGSEPEEAAVA